jgi:hypothetical protein
MDVIYTEKSSRQHSEKKRKPKLLMERKGIITYVKILSVVSNGMDMEFC